MPTRPAVLAAVALWLAIPPAIGARRAEFDLVVALSGAKEQYSEDTPCFVTAGTRHPLSGLANVTSGGGGGDRASLNGCSCRCAADSRRHRFAVFVIHRSGAGCFCTNSIKKVGFAAPNREACRDTSLSVRFVTDVSNQTLESLGCSSELPARRTVRVNLPLLLRKRTVSVSRPGTSTASVGAEVSVRGEGQATLRGAAKAAVNGSAAATSLIRQVANGTQTMASNSLRQNDTNVNERRPFNVTTVKVTQPASLNITATASNTLTNATTSAENITEHSTAGTATRPVLPVTVTVLPDSSKTANESERSNSPSPQLSATVNSVNYSKSAVLTSSARQLEGAKIAIAQITKATKAVKAARLRQQASPEEGGDNQTIGTQSVQKAAHGRLEAISRGQNATLQATVTKRVSEAERQRDSNSETKGATSPAVTRALTKLKERKTAKTHEVLQTKEPSSRVASSATRVLQRAAAEVQKAKTQTAAVQRLQSSAGKEQQKIENTVRVRQRAATLVTNSGTDIQRRTEGNTRTLPVVRAQSISQSGNATSVIAQLKSNATTNRPETATETATSTQHNQPPKSGATVNQAQTRATNKTITTTPSDDKAKTITAINKVQPNRTRKVRPSAGNNVQPVNTARPMDIKPPLNDIKQIKVANGTSRSKAAADRMTPLSTTNETTHKPGGTEALSNALSQSNTTTSTNPTSTINATSLSNVNNTTTQQSAWTTTRQSNDTAQPRSISSAPPPKAVATKLPLNTPAISSTTNSTTQSSDANVSAKQLTTASRSLANTLAQPERKTVLHSDKTSSEPNPTNALESNRTNTTQTDAGSLAEITKKIKILRLGKANINAKHNTTNTLPSTNTVEQANNITTTRSEPQTDIKNTTEHQRVTEPSATPSKSRASLRNSTQPTITTNITQPIVTRNVKTQLDVNSTNHSAPANATAQHTSPTNLTRQSENTTNSTTRPSTLRLTGTTGRTAAVPAPTRRPERIQPDVPADGGKFTKNVSKMIKKSMQDRTRGKQKKVARGTFEKLVSHSGNGPSSNKAKDPPNASRAEQSRHENHEKPHNGTESARSGKAGSAMVPSRIVQLLGLRLAGSSLGPAPPAAAVSPRQRMHRRVRAEVAGSRLPTAFTVSPLGRLSAFRRKRASLLNKKD